MFQVTLRIGRAEVKGDFTDMKEAHKFLATYGCIPDKCTNCQSENINLSHRHVGGNDYYCLHCAKCGADGNFGQYKTGGGLYWKGAKMEVYKGGDNDHQEEEKKPLTPQEVSKKILELDTEAFLRYMIVTKKLSYGQNLLDLSKEKLHDIGVHWDLVMQKFNEFKGRK